MSEKSKRDLIWEKKKKEREERQKKQRDGDSGSEYPQQPSQPQIQQNFNNDYDQIPKSNNGFREKNKPDVWQTNDVFEPNPNQNVNSNFAPQTQVRQSRGSNNNNNNKQFEPNPNQIQQQQIIPQSQGLASQQQNEAPQFRNQKNKFIQAQVVNQPIEVQNSNIQQNSEIAFEAQVQNDQRTQKQQYGNQLQQQMMEKQMQQEREKQQKDQERQKMEEERKRAEIQKQQDYQQKQQDQEREKKEQYRIQLQEQMKQKEISQQQQNYQFQQQQQQQQQQGLIAAQQYNNQPYQQKQQPQQQQGFEIGERQQNANANTKQEYGQYLRNQMQNKNQNNNSQIDKKAQLQQQMEVQNQTSLPQSQGQNNKNSFARKNINQMYNQAVPQGNMQPQINQAPLMSPLLNQQDTLASVQQQRQQFQNNYHQQPQQQQAISTPQIYHEAFQNQGNSQLYHQQQQQQFDNPQSQIKNEQDQFELQQNINDQNKVNPVRGNRNFMKLENADMVEVNKKQQQKTEYQKELERQIQEKKRQKELEQERIKREELLEEQRVQKEQEMQKRQIEEENNSKKQQKENLQKENEQLRDQKKQNKRQNDDAPSTGNKNIKAKQYDNVLPINQVSREFLNEEKKNEGLDPRASLMDFERKKSSQFLNAQQQNAQTPQSAQSIQSGGQTPINMNQNQQGQMFNQMGMNNMGQIPNNFNQQNGMMYGNQFMMGQYPMGYGGMGGMAGMGGMGGMMMNPQMMQQQQMIAKQQAEILPQLYELRLQMQQQQLQMQQQIDLIKNQANVAIEERNTAELKYKELKKQYQLKQNQEKNYQQQLQDALSKNHPSNKPHQLLQNHLEFMTPTPPMGGPPLYQGPAKYEFHQNQDDSKSIKPFPNYGGQNEQPKYQYDNKLDPAAKAISSQPQINIIKHQEPVNSQQQKKQQNSMNSMPSNNNFELDSNPNQLEHNDQAEKAMQDYLIKMHQYGMKSLVSDNKFIPLDILDKVKDSQITMSKLGNYGVNGSQINHVSAQNLGNPAQNQNNQEYNAANPGYNVGKVAYNGGNGLGKRPQSHHKSSNDFGNKDNKYDIPSMNSDIIKEIDNMMNKNNLGDQYATQQSFYQQNPRQIKEPQKINNENQNGINEYNPLGNNNNNDNIYGQKPPSRLGSNQEMRRTGREQNNAFGNAARGILGNSKAFDYAKQNQIKSSNTFKTNADQEGYNLGSDFPDFSINDKIGLNQFGQKNKQTVQQNGSEINFRGSALLKNDIPSYNNNNTYNTNNFDIDKINQRNDDRLQKLNQFNIPTINNNNEFLTDKKEIPTLKIKNGGDDDDYFKKLDELLIRPSN